VNNWGENQAMIDPFLVDSMVFAIVGARFFLKVFKRQHCQAQEMKQLQLFSKNL